MRMLISASLPLLLAACTAGTDDLQPIGSDRDAYGCIGSAGYSWCERTAQCERPWELAQSQGFGNNQESFVRFCES